MTTSIISSVTSSFSKVGFELKKHSPEILVAAGIVGGVASAVMACRATLKVNDILEKSKEDINAIHEVAENESPEVYSEQDAKKDLVKVYAKTGVELVKLYGPSVALGAVSITSIAASHNILHKRNVAIAAAYATVDKSFKDYRGRVIDRFGEKVDKELKYGLKAKKVKETVVDEETGEVKQVKVIKQYANPDEVSGYARFFDEYTRDEYGNVVKNPCWDKNNEYNLMFLKAQQKIANDRLISKRRLSLNEVYEMLGLPSSKAGQVVGWVYDPENPDHEGDNYVDFGIYAAADNYSDFIYNDNEAILLDFNVDGNILNSWK